MYLDQTRYDTGVTPHITVEIRSNQSGDKYWIVSFGCREGITYISKRHNTIMTKQKIEQELRKIVYLDKEYDLKTAQVVLRYQGMISTLTDIIFEKITGA